MAVTRMRKSERTGACLRKEASVGSVYLEVSRMQVVKFARTVVPWRYVSVASSHSLMEFVGS